MKSKGVILLLCAIPLSLGMLSSCAHEDVEWVDLEDFSGLDPTKSFIPFKAEENEIGRDLIASCPLPDGESVGSLQTKSTSIPAAQFVEELLSTFGHGKIRSYCGSYYSSDEYGNPVRVSGRITIPADKKVSRILLVSHYTITDDASVPSQRLQLESIFASYGLAVIDSDYLGYGISKGTMHPYLIPSQASRDVIGMYYASLPFLEAIGAKPQYDDILMLGYSQGGATTVSVGNELLISHPDVKIRLNMAGGGPYDLCLTYDKMVEEDFSQIPVVIPMIIRSMKYSCHLDNMDLSEYLQPHVLENMDEWIDSKNYTISAISTLLGTRKLSDILTEDAMNKVSDSMGDLYLAMMTQSAIYELVIPETPLYLFHSMDDNVVPFGNSEALLNKFQGYANMTYNFGHYGSHSSGMLRFLVCCGKLLKENGDI